MAADEEGLNLEPDKGGDESPKEEKPPAKPRSRGGGRPPRETVSTELKGSISGGLNELAEWLDGRDEELAATLRDSAPKIAEFLSVHAAKRARVARVVKTVFAKGGPFAALRAFGPMTRAVADRVGARRVEAAEENAGEIVRIEDGEPRPADS